MDKSPTQPSLRPQPAIPNQAKKFKYTLTFRDLDNTSNEFFLGLKKVGWSYIVINGKEDHFFQDTGRDCTVNHQKKLNPHGVEEFAKKHPLINDYIPLHTQKWSYPFSSAILSNMLKANLYIAYKNEFKNIGVSKTSVFCETDNDLLIFINPNMKDKHEDKKLFSMPGCIQTVFEKVGKYNLWISYVEDPIPSDAEIKENPKKLYFYINKDGNLEYAICNEQAKVQRIIVDKQALGEVHAQYIIDNLKKSSSDSQLEKPNGVEALYAFSQLTEKAGYPIACVKLKEISCTNKVLLDLVSTNVGFQDKASKNLAKPSKKIGDSRTQKAELEKLGNEAKAEKLSNETKLEKLICEAKKEESKESLYLFYKEQAKVFFSRQFSIQISFYFDVDAVRQTFLLEVNQFLLDRYPRDKTEFSKFFLEFHQEKLNKMIEEGESMESLYEWFEELSKFFFSDNFVSCYGDMLDCNDLRQKFLVSAGLFFPQKIVRPLPSDPSGLNGAIDCSQKYKLILRLYSITQKGKAQFNDVLIPQPLPAVFLNDNHKLCIKIPKDAQKFISAFRAYKKELFDKVFCFPDGNENISAVFENSHDLKMFLIACEVPPVTASLLVEKLYEELSKEKKPEIPKQNDNPGKASSEFKKTPGQRTRVPLPIPNNRQNIDTTQAVLLNSVRSHSTANPLGVVQPRVCIPYIDIFAKFAYKYFIRKEYNHSEKISLPKVELNAEGVLSIEFSGVLRKEFKNPEELKAYFGQSDGFHQVNVEKLYEALRVKYPQSDQPFLSNFSNW